MNDDVTISDYQRLKNFSSNLHFFRSALNEKRVEKNKLSASIENAETEIAETEENLKALVLKLGLGGAA